MKTVNNSCSSTDLRLTLSTPSAQLSPPSSLESTALVDMLCRHHPTPSAQLHRPPPLSDAQLQSILQQALDLADSLEDILTEDAIRDR
jgi:hypothetical protein